MNREQSADLKPRTVCPACYSSRVEADAKQCDVCGKLLSEGFQPLDAIRSSYGMQRKRLDFQQVNTTESLFEDKPLLASSAAWACTVYSMVPYLGVLFVPFAIALGWLGYLKDRRRPGSGATQATLAPVALSMVLLALQVLLWWLLYLIPEIGI